jgi:signal transduction histidine kinase
VRDNGIGFDRGVVTPGGLLGMEARVAAAGGRLRLDTAPGRGTTLTGEFPPLDAVG